MEAAQVKRNSRAVWRKPATIIGMLIAVAILINASLIFFFMVRPILMNTLAEERLSEKEQQLEQLILVPEPARVSDQEIAALVEEVPLKLDASRYYSQLVEYAERNKIVLLGFKQLSTTIAASSELEQQIQALTNNSNATAAAMAGSVVTPVSPQAQPQQQPVGTNASRASMVQKDTFELSVVGVLSDLLQFFDSIAGNHQIMEITDWRMAKLEADDPLFHLVIADHDIYTLDLTLAMYSIPQHSYLLEAEPSNGTSIEDALHRFKQRYPEIEQLNSLKQQQTNQ